MLIFRVLGHAAAVVVSADSKGDPEPMKISGGGRRGSEQFRVHSSGGTLGGSLAYGPGMMGVQRDANSWRKHFTQLHMS